MPGAELRTILLAEDTPSIRMTLTIVLETIGGFVVRACDDGDGALAEARRARPDLIILDWVMPRSDGRTTITEIRRDSRLRDIPVVIVTARTCPDEVAEMIRLGAADVIGKPFDPVRLPDRLRQVWAEATGRAGPEAARPASGPPEKDVPSTGRRSRQTS